MNHQELNWTSSDGLQLFAQVWQPPSAPRAVVCLVHGLGEHSGRYAHVADALGQAGYALLAFDQRGNGRSPGRRGHSPSFEALMDDIGLLLDQAEQRFPGRPRFLYGHSMGGNLVLNYALRHRPQLAGVVATSPWLRTATANAPPDWQLSLSELLDRLWPTFTMPTGLDPQFLSHDPAVVQTYVDDPWVHDRLSAGLVTKILNSGRWVLEHAAEFPLPLLLMHGSADQITDPEASRKVAGRVPENCTFKLWEGLYHETHNETEKKDVLAFLTDWLQRHT